MNIENLVRPNILALKPYSSARSEFKGGGATLLDANENGHDLFGDALNRYPDPLQIALKAEIAKLKNVPPACIFLGNGSDEAIDLLFRVFCRPGEDEVVICPPTYGMYQVQADIHGVQVREALLDGFFHLRPEAVLAATHAQTKLLFLCSPNNPTGNLLDAGAMEYLLENFPGMVVVDEAYVDFAQGRSWSQRLAGFPNLVVLQTLSKAWALAGVRLGMAFASEQVIGFLNKVKFPYNISLPAQQAALAALRSDGQVGRVVKDILTQREWLQKELSVFSFVKKTHPSDANFLLVEFENSPLVFNHLRSKNVIVRDRSKEPLCDRCLRLTVGTQAENELLVKALHQLTP